jgi:Tol biopolymer transport system component
VETAPAERSKGVRPREITAWALAALTVAVLGVKLIQGNEAPATPPAAFKLTVPIEGEADLRYSHGGLAISPDGSRIAYINNKKLFVRRLDSWDPIEIPQTEGVSTPFWSPDGQWLAFSIDKEMWKVRSDGTQRTKICSVEESASNVTGGAWLADDRIVYRGKQDLMGVPASGGIPVSFLSADDSAIVDYHQPESLPKGQGLVVAVHTQDGVNTISIVGQDGTMTDVLNLPGSDLGDPCYAPSGHLLFQDKQDIWAVQFSLEQLAVQDKPFPAARDAAVPTVSNDGTFTYVRNAGEIMRRFVLVDRTGTIVQELGQPADLWAAYALSPDGSRAVGPNSNSLDLWLYDDRNARLRVTFTDIEHDMPSFSWDGQTVFFATGIESEYTVGSQSIGRNEPEKMLVPTGDLGAHYYATCPAVTRDGNILFYTSIGAGKKQDIAWIDLSSGGKPQAFLTGAAGEFAARPSPADPRYVAYVSDESGTGQVYLTTWPDADQKLQASIDGGFWPRWKGDGSELYFASGNEIFAVAVAYDPLRIGRPTRLFSRPENDDRQPFGWTATFDVTFDGDRFLVTDLVLDDKMEAEIAIIQNWSPDLE